MSVRGLVTEPGAKPEGCGVSIGSGCRAGGTGTAAYSGFVFHPSVDLGFVSSPSGKLGFVSGPSGAAMPLQTAGRRTLLF